MAVLTTQRILDEVAGHSGTPINALLRAAKNRHTAYTGSTFNSIVSIDLRSADPVLQAVQAMQKQGQRQFDIARSVEQIDRVARLERTIETIKGIAHRIDESTVNGAAKKYGEYRNFNNAQQISVNSRVIQHVNSVTAHPETPATLLRNSLLGSFSSARNDLENLSLEQQFAAEVRLRTTVARTAGIQFGGGHTVGTKLNQLVLC